MSGDSAADERSLGALERALPDEVDLVVVADGVEAPAAPARGEVVRTSAPLGAGAALNIGIRRSRAPVVVTADSSIAATGDFITPLVSQLDDASVGIAGVAGYASADLQRFEAFERGAGPVDAAAVRGPIMAFRRSDAAVRGPVDEAFRAEGALDLWWSLVLRDQGEGAAPRRAVVVPGLPIQLMPAGGSEMRPSAARDRLAKRNFYRVLDRFRTRLDLAVPRSADR